MQEEIFQRLVLDLLEANEFSMAGYLMVQKPEGVYDRK
jgi:hypothetical protein